MMDPTSKFVKSRDLDILFVEVNIEEDGDSEEGLMNPDRALLRFEFVDAVIRMAHRKYVMVSASGLCAQPFNVSSEQPHDPSVWSAVNLGP